MSNDQPRLAETLAAADEFSLDPPEESHAYAQVLLENNRLRHELDLRNCALNAAASHFMLVDMQQPERPIVFANRALASNHGYSIEDLIGQSVKILFYPERNAQQLKNIEQALAAGKDVDCELTAMRRDGSAFYVGAYIAPLLDNEGRMTHCVSVGADITARLEAERKEHELQDQLKAEMRERERLAIELRLAQKLESVGRLASGIAHEINTPIQYIGDSVYFLQGAVADLEKLVQQCRASLQRVADGSAPAAEIKAVTETEAALDMEFIRTEIPKAFERTLEGVERVTGIVRAMKEFAHPDLEEQNLSDINHALETTLTVARNEYKYLATINTQFAEIPPIMCNIGQLNQVFLNIVVNAAHAIEESGKNVDDGRIELATSTEGNFVIICISDNGCGIPQPNIDKIFDPFFTTKDVGKGTGQGLAIARSIIVEKHGGDLLVESTVGSGTRFLMKLPIGGRGTSQVAA